MSLHCSPSSVCPEQWLCVSSLLTATLSDITLVLHAQCRRSRSKHCVDRDGFLRPAGHPDQDRRVILGDVADLALRTLGGREPAEVDFTKGRMDEQAWTIETMGMGIHLRMTSRSYWGWGFFTRSFAVRLQITSDPLTLKRYVFDLVTTLGNPGPWVIVAPWFWKKLSGQSVEETRTAWVEQVDGAREDVEEAIEIHAQSIVQHRKALGHLGQPPEGFSLSMAESDVVQASRNLDQAREALSERNLPAVDRALARCEEYIQRAKPAGQLAATALEEEEGEPQHILDMGRTAHTISLNDESLPIIDLTATDSDAEE